MRKLLSILAVGTAVASGSTAAAPFFFSTGNPDGRIATASRPGAGGLFEIESADDFVLTDPTAITSATFTGLLTGGATAANVGEVAVEIYRVFPLDSDTGRTSGPPTFSTSSVPTRVNSPSDVAFASRDTAAGDMSFTTNLLASSFTALNSVLPGGVHPQPNQTTLGNGAVTGSEVLFNVAFAPFVLDAGHYFFIPQVEVTAPAGNSADFLWLSAPKPIIPSPGTPFVPDLQSWTRDHFLDPDWLRVGTDIVGRGAFNAAFTLSGQTIPEPATLALVGLGLAGLAASRRRVLRA